MRGPESTRRAWVHLPRAVGRERPGLTEERLVGDSRPSALSQIFSESRIVNFSLVGAAVLVLAVMSKLRDVITQLKPHYCRADPRWSQEHLSCFHITSRPAADIRFVRGSDEAARS